MTAAEAPTHLSYCQEHRRSNRDVGLDGGYHASAGKAIFRRRASISTLHDDEIEIQAEKCALLREICRGTTEEPDGAPTVAS